MTFTGYCSFINRSKVMKFILLLYTANPTKTVSVNKILIIIISFELCLSDKIFFIIIVPEGTRTTPTKKK